MPRVPTANGAQLQVQQLNPVRQQNVDVSSGARALGQGIYQVGEAIDQIALREDRARADQADAQITTEWLKWDAENRNKFRGQNTDGYEPAAQEWWSKAAEAYGKDLNPRARQIASSSLMRKQGSALANVAQFVGSEKERFADDSASASITSTIQFGITTGDVAGAAEQVRGQVAAVGARKGWTTEQVQAEQLKNLSSLHLAQITKMAEQDPVKAQEYYQANKAEVMASNQPRVEEVLRKEVDNQFAAKFAAENATKPLAEQLNERRKAWIAGGAVCSEMEAATVFVVSSILRKRAGGVMLIVGSHAGEHGTASPVVALDRLISTGVDAIKLLIERDRRLTS